MGNIKPAKQVTSTSSHKAQRRDRVIVAKTEVAGRTYTVRIPQSELLKAYADAVNNMR